MSMILDLLYVLGLLLTIGGAFWLVNIDWDTYRQINSSSDPRSCYNTYMTTESPYVVSSSFLELSAIKAPKIYNWEPLEDITAYELAKCIPILISNAQFNIDIMVESLPDNARRHFKERN